jgi:hypothetical protein
VPKKQAGEGLSAEANVIDSGAEGVDFRLIFQCDRCAVL